VRQAYGRMKEPTFTSTDLERLGQQLESWRKRPGRDRRLPPQLWAAATDLAVIFGVSLVSHFLRIDYRKLSSGPVRRCSGLLRSFGEGPFRLRPTSSRAARALPKRSIFRVLCYRVSLESPG
jgi:hypothetical protein